MQPQQPLKAWCEKVNSLLHFDAMHWFGISELLITNFMLFATCVHHCCPHSLHRNFMTALSLVCHGQLPIDLKMGLFLTDRSLDFVSCYFHCFRDFSNMLFLQLSASIERTRPPGSGTFQTFKWQGGDRYVASSDMSPCETSKCPFYHKQSAKDAHPTKSS